LLRKERAQATGIIHVSAAPGVVRLNGSGGSDAKGDRRPLYIDTPRVRTPLIPMMFSKKICYPSRSAWGGEKGTVGKRSEGSTRLKRRRPQACVTRQSLKGGGFGWWVWGGRGWGGGGPTLESGGELLKKFKKSASRSQPGGTKTGIRTARISSGWRCKTQF